MPYKIAVASGKGGTGKTTVSVNLFHHFANSFGAKVHLVDCDVEVPNDLIFFSDAIKVSEKNIRQLIPEINNDKCSYCRKCAEYCEFNAIVVIPPIKFAEVNSSLCHSCGACMVACKKSAIKKILKTIGKVSSYKTKEGHPITQGKLEIGSAMQTMLIKELKKHIPEDNEIILYDAPPGTSCPVVETIVDADYVVLVTEPTPFGLHDLKLMVELLKETKNEFGVIVNKAGLGDDSIYQYLKENSIDLLGDIPFSSKYAATYSTGNICKNIPAEIANSYKKIIDILDQKVVHYEGDNYFKW